MDADPPFAMNILPLVMKTFGRSEPRHIGC